MRIGKVLGAFDEDGLDSFLGCLLRFETKILGINAC
jgi:hypothetical protein